MDALAVLENARFHWMGKERNSTNQSTFSNPHLFAASINVSEAIPIVRKAIQAGILNDLGSGSHVDICLIRADGVSRWRERLVSSWEAEKLQAGADRQKSTTVRNQDDSSNRSIANRSIGGEHSSVDSEAEKSCSKLISQSTEMNHKVLGRKLFSRKRLMKTIINGEVREVWTEKNVLKELSTDIEIL